MRPTDVVIILDEFSEQAVEVSLVEDDHMVEQLAANCPDKSFDERILPWTSVGCPHGFYATSFQEIIQAKAIDSIVVVEKIFGLAAEGRCLANLLYDPLQGRMEGTGEVDDFSPAVIEDEEDVYNLERQCRHGEEVDGPRAIQVVFQKGSLGRRPMVRIERFDHIFTDGFQIGRLVAE